MRALLHFYFITLFAAGFISCTQTRYIPVDTVKQDSIFLNHSFHDSIIIRDSVTVYQAGDTIYVDKVRYRYRDRSVRDTVYRYLDRVVQVPYPVEKKLSRMEETLIGLGRFFIFLVFLWSLILGLRKLRK